MAPRVPRRSVLPVRAAANRAAWLYWNRGLTQQDVAARLGVSRTSVIRLIEEARSSGEIKIILEAGQDSDIPLALDLEERFGLLEAIAVPPSEKPEVAIGRALGVFLTQVVTSGMTIGVGWGRTLDAALTTFEPAQLQGVTVCSLLGGLIELNTRNPVEFAWRFAEAAGARCLLMLSPLVVDSAETRRRLIEGTDLASLFRRIDALDIAVLGCGEADQEGSSTFGHELSPESQHFIRKAGGIAEVLCQFLTLAGEEICYPEVDRLMASELTSISKAGAIVLAGGGPRRAPALVAACRRFKGVTLVTDAPTAKAMLALSRAPEVHLPPPHR